MADQNRTSMSRPGSPSCADAVHRVGFLINLRRFRVAYHAVIGGSFSHGHQLAHDINPDFFSVAFQRVAPAAAARSLEDELVARFDFDLVAL